MKRQSKCKLKSSDPTTTTSHGSSSQGHNEINGGEWNYNMYSLGRCLGVLGHTARAAAGRSLGRGLGVTELLLLGRPRVAAQHPLILHVLRAEGRGQRQGAVAVDRRRVLLRTQLANTGQGPVQCAACSRLQR